MRVRTQANQAMPAALALARILRITPREALTLLGAPRVLPFEFDADAAQSTVAALRAQGAEAEALEVPPTTRRCATHPSLTGEAPCEDCRALVCPLCLPFCRACAARRATAARWKRIRVSVLVVLLLGLVAFAGLRQRKLDRRTAWRQPLRISVVLVSDQPIDQTVVSAWSSGLETLDDWFASEAARLGLPLARPVHFELAPSTVLADVPRPPAGTGRWLADSQQALELRSTLTELSARGHAPAPFDVVLLVALREANGAHRVEGVAEAGGSIGLVEGTAGDTALTLELTAVAHELLHCLGAVDGYDADGHALPRGLVGEGLAEVMVGEVPLGPGRGRVPKSLEELRIGEATAREVGLLKSE